MDKRSFDMALSKMEKRPDVTRYPASLLSEITLQFDDRFTMEPVLDYPWNPCSESRGMAARFSVESVLEMAWNTQAERFVPFLHLSLLFSAPFESIGGFLVIFRQRAP